jgi:hypothetical protein
MSRAKTNPLSREEQWIVNSQQRAKRIKASGGRQLLVLLDAEHNARLEQVLEHRRRTDPRLSITEWVRRMIQVDYKQMMRRPSVKQQAAAASGNGRSSESARP